MTCNSIFQYPPISDVPELAPRVLSAVFADREQFERINADGGSYRFFVQPIHHRGEIVGAVAVGRSEAEINALLDRLRGLGLVGLVVALAAAWAGGTFLAGRALRPVDRITRAAEQIGAEDLSMRLENSRGRRRAWAPDLGVQRHDRSAGAGVPASAALHGRRLARAANAVGGDPVAG